MALRYGTLRNSTLRTYK